jgi:hypothetical protein
MEHTSHNHMNSNLSQSATSSSYATVEWLYDLWGCSPQRLGQEPANRWKSSISTAAFYLHVTGLEDCCICIVVFGKRCGDSRGDPVLMRCRGAQDMNALWCLTFQLDPCVRWNHLVSRPWSLLGRIPCKSRRPDMYLQASSICAAISKSNEISEKEDDSEKIASGRRRHLPDEHCQAGRAPPGST